MMSLKNIFLYIFLISTCIVPTAAQPGGECSSVFDLQRVCQIDYKFKEFVFSGKVSARDDKTLKVGNQWLWEINLVEIVQIKGAVPKTLKIYLDQTVCRGLVEAGKKYIFTAHRLKRAGFNGLVSYRWSTSLDAFADDDIAEIVKKIQVVTKRKKQPSVTGKVFQYNTDPLGNDDFKGKSLLTKLGYNPEYATPLGGIKVLAKNRQNKIIETVTGKTGEFVFMDLKNGVYEILPVLSEKKNVKVFQYYNSVIEESNFRPVTTEKSILYVSNEFCSEEIRFNRSLWV